MKTRSKYILLIIPLLLAFASLIPSQVSASPLFTTQASTNQVEQGGQYFLHSYFGAEVYLYMITTGSGNAEMQLQVFNQQTGSVIQTNTTYPKGSNCPSNGSFVNNETVCNTFGTVKTGIPFTFVDNNVYYASGTNSPTVFYVIWYGVTQQNLYWEQVNLTYSLGTSAKIDFGPNSYVTAAYAPVSECVLTTVCQTVLSAVQNPVNGQLGIGMVEQQFANNGVTPQAVLEQWLVNPSGSGSPHSFISHYLNVVAGTLGLPYVSVQETTDGVNLLALVSGQPNVYSLGPSTTQMYVNGVGQSLTSFNGLGGGNSSATVTLDNSNGTQSGSNYAAASAYAFTDNIGDMSVGYEQENGVSPPTLTTYYYQNVATGIDVLSAFQIPQGQFGILYTAADYTNYYIDLFTVAPYQTNPLAMTQYTVTLSGVGGNVYTRNTALNVDSESNGVYGLTYLLWGVWNPTPKTWTVYTYNLPNFNKQSISSTSTVTSTTFTTTTYSGVTHYSYASTTMNTTITQPYSQSPVFQSSIIFLVMWILLPAFIFTVVIGVLGFGVGSIMGAWIGTYSGSVPLWVSMVFSFMFILMFFLYRDKIAVGGLIGKLHG